MNRLNEQGYKPETRGHKARGYDPRCNMNPVAAGFMPACFGFVPLSAPSNSENV